MPPNNQQTPYNCSVCLANKKEKDGRPEVFVTTAGKAGLGSERAAKRGIS